MRGEKYDDGEDGRYNGEDSDDGDIEEKKNKNISDI